MVQEPRFEGMEWYAGYSERTAQDGVEGRLVSMFTFDAPWTSWEMHPSGGELVVCTAGKLTLLQEIDGKVCAVTLGPGEAVINPPGVWHTADVDGPCTALFITSGAGTQNRAR
jgi:quercetin dioxygenase-like cupin family protein